MARRSIRTTRRRRWRSPAPTPRSRGSRRARACCRSPRRTTRPSSRWSGRFPERGLEQAEAILPPVELLLPAAAQDQGGRAEDAGGDGSGGVFRQLLLDRRLLGAAEQGGVELLGAQDVDQGVVVVQIAVLHPERAKQGQTE